MKVQVQPHAVPKSFATLCIPSPSDAVFDCGEHLALSGGQRHHLPLLGPHLVAVSASHDNSG